MKKNLLYDTFQVNRKLPLNYEEITGKETFIVPQYSLQPTYSCEIENAYVTPYGIVFKNWKVVKESLYTMFVKNNYYPTFLKKRLLGKVKKVPGTSILAHHTFYDNYYHWTAEALPRLFSVKEYAAKATLLVHEKAPQFVKNYINLLGFKNITIIKDEELVLAEKLIMPTHTAAPAEHFMHFGKNPNSPAINREAASLHHNEKLFIEMTAWLKTQAAKVVNKDFSDFRNVYVSRQKAAYRKVLNESEIIALVKRYGFKVINFEDYSVPEQIMLMSHVRNFVAIHGAGITNIMYMPQNGLVVNLIHENHLDPAFYNLGAALNHDTVFIQGKAANQDTRGVAWDNFSIETEKLKFYLDNHLRS